MDYIINALIGKIVLFSGDLMMSFMEAMILLLKLISSQSFLLGIFFVLLSRTLLNKGSQLYYKKLNSIHDFVFGVVSYKDFVLRSGNIIAFSIFWLVFILAAPKAFLELEPYQDNWIAMFNKGFFASIISIFSTIFVFAAAIKLSFLMMLGLINSLSDINLKNILWFVKISDNSRLSKS